MSVDHHEQSAEPATEHITSRSEHTDSMPLGLTTPQVVPIAPASILSDPRLSGRGNAPVRNAAVLQLQRTYGNRATLRFLQRHVGGQKTAAKPAAVFVQRTPSFNVGPPVRPDIHHDHGFLD